MGELALLFLNDQRRDGITEITGISVDISDYSNAAGVPERDGSEGS